MLINICYPVFEVTLPLHEISSTSLKLNLNLKLFEKYCLYAHILHTIQTFVQTSENFLHFIICNLFFCSNVGWEVVVKLNGLLSHSPSIYGVPKDTAADLQSALKQAFLK